MGADALTASLSLKVSTFVSISILPKLLGLDLRLNQCFYLILLRSCCCSGGGVVAAVLSGGVVVEVLSTGAAAGDHGSSRWCCRHLRCRAAAGICVHYDLLPLPSSTQTSPIVECSPRKVSYSLFSLGRSVYVCFGWTNVTPAPKEYLKLISLVKMWARFW
jgi:hypothetical protein